MEDLNLLGAQVSGMSEAIELLGCTDETLINDTASISVNGIDFNLYVYRTENNKNWFYSAVPTNLISNQYKKYTNKTLKELKGMLSDFSKGNKGNSIVNTRNMFDLKLITYKEYVVLKEYVLDNNL